MRVYSADLYDAYVNAWLIGEVQAGHLRIEPELVKQFFEDLSHLMSKRNVIDLDAVSAEALIPALIESSGLASQTGNSWSGDVYEYLH